MQTRLVVITRPSAQAEGFAQQVLSIGRQPVLFPLLEIAPLPDQTLLKAALAEIKSCALLAFVGPNAIDAAFAHLDAWPREVPIAIMGEGSRKALARHGITEENARIFMPLDAVRSDSETLLNALDIDAIRGKKVMIVRGNAGRELLAEALRSAGCQVTQVAAYLRSSPVLDKQMQARLLDLLETPNDWVISSSEALRNLVQMVNGIAGSMGVAKLQQQHILASHVRIAESARHLDFVNVTHAGSGDERLLAALQSCHE